MHVVRRLIPDVNVPDEDNVQNYMLATCGAAVTKVASVVYVGCSAIIDELGWGIPVIVVAGAAATAIYNKIKTQKEIAYTVKYSDLCGFIAKHPEVKFIGTEQDEITLENYRDNDQVCIIDAGHDQDGKPQFAIKSIAAVVEYVERGLLVHFTNARLKSVSPNDARFEGLIFTVNVTIKSAVSKAELFEQFMTFVISLGSALTAVLWWYTILAPTQLADGTLLPEALKSTELIAIANSMQGKEFEPFRQTVTALAKILSDYEMQFPDVAYNTKALMYNLAVYVIHLSYFQSSSKVEANIGKYCSISKQEPALIDYTDMLKLNKELKNPETVISLMESSMTKWKKLKGVDRPLPLEDVSKLFRTIFKQYKIEAWLYQCKGIYDGSEKKQRDLANFLKISFENLKKMFYLEGLSIASLNREGPRRVNDYMWGPHPWRDFIPRVIRDGFRELDENAQNQANEL